MADSTARQGQGRGRRRVRAGGRAANAMGRFKTDADIAASLSGSSPGSAGSTGQIQERQLQPWVDDSVGSDLPLAAESLSQMQSDAPWDQFEANKRKFGVKTTYDELYYTTAIDRSSPDFARRERKADLLAREIDTRARAAEVRQGDVDDEDLYSGVARTPAEASAKTGQENTPARSRPRTPARSRSTSRPSSRHSDLSKGGSDSDQKPRAQLDAFVAREGAAVRPGFAADREEEARKQLPKHSVGKASNEGESKRTTPPPRNTSNGSVSPSPEASKDIPDINATETKDTPDIKEAPKATPRKNRFNFSSAAKAAAFRPSGSLAFSPALSQGRLQSNSPSVSSTQLKSFEGVPGAFDYIYNLSQEDKQKLPPPFTTPPAWSESDVSYAVLFQPPPMPMMVPMEALYPPFRGSRMI